MVAALLLTATASAAAGSPGTTRAHIAAARRRLTLLEGRISAEQGRVDAMQAELRILAMRVARGRALYDAIHSRVVQLGVELGRTRTHYHAIRSRLDARIRDIYMQGPANGMEAILGARSLPELSDRVQFVNDVAQADSDLATRTQHLAAALAITETHQRVLLQQQGVVVGRVTAEQDALQQSFADEQSHLSALARARAEVGSLLGRLRKRLHAEEVAAAQAVLDAGTPLSFGGWAAAFLRSIGAAASRNNLVVMVAWQTAEYTQARWNPLATTYPMPGSTTFNSAGVRNYTSLSQGLEATRLTLRASGYGYGAILGDLARSGDPLTTAQAINASSWCHGCASGQYVIGLVPAVEAYYGRYAGG